MARPKQTIPQAIEPIPMDEVINPKQAQADRDIANQLIGRIQLARGVANLLTVSSLTDIKRVKELKLYKGLPRKSTNGELLTVSTFEEFCDELGYSRQKIDQDLLNLEAFGSEALESMQQIGLGLRDLRKLRQMPDEDRNLVIEQVTVDTGDKEAVKESILELLETQSKKHEREKAELKAKAENAERALEVKDKVIAQKTAEIQKRDKTVAELEAANAVLLGNDNGVDGIDVLNNKLADKLSSLVNSVLSVDMMRLRKQIIEIQQANAPEHIQLQCGQAVVMLIAELQSMQVEYQLEVPSVMNTSWMDNIPDDVQD